MYYVQFKDLKQTTGTMKKMELQLFYKDWSKKISSCNNEHIDHKYKRQSPIDIPQAKRLFCMPQDYHFEFELNDKDIETQIKFMNNNQTVYLEGDFGFAYYKDPQSEQKFKYNLERIEIKKYSEHNSVGLELIEYVLEIQIFGEIETPSLTQDQYIAISFWYKDDRRKKADPFIKKIKKDQKFVFNPQKDILYKESFETFYSYRGSWSYPPCDENVTWFIIGQNLRMLPSQFTKLSEFVVNNKRDTQVFEYNIMKHYYRHDINLCQGYKHKEDL